MEPPCPSKIKKKLRKPRNEIFRDERGNVLPVKRSFTIGSVLIRPLPYGKILRLFRYGVDGKELLQVGVDHTEKPEIDEIERGDLKGIAVLTVGLHALKISGLLEKKDPAQEEQQKYMESKIENPQSYQDFIRHESWGYKYIGPSSIYRLTIPEIKRLGDGQEAKMNLQKEQKQKQAPSQTKQTEPDSVDFEKLAEVKEESEGSEKRL